MDKKFKDHAPGDPVCAIYDRYRIHALIHAKEGEILPKWSELSDKAKIEWLKGTLESTLSLARILREELSRDE